MRQTEGPSKLVLTRIAGWLRATYGSKKGYLIYWPTRGKLAIVGYEHFADIDWARVQRLVFVCKGNICRSPYAESKATTMGVTATSAGIEAASQRDADLVAIRVAKE